MGTVFPGPSLVAAIVDRVTFNAHIIETGTQSYPLATSKTHCRRKQGTWLCLRCVLHLPNLPAT
jgi:hypothetical protein